MNFIRKIFEDRIDEETHRQFKRFSKGNFENRAVIEIAITGKGLKVKTSFEFVNDLTNYLVNTIKDKVHITGGIITTKDIKEGLGFEISNIKQFAGVKTYEIDTEIAKDDLFKVMDKFPDAVYCLSFTTESGSLKTKVKTPKAAKPGKGEDGEVKANYCVFSTSDLSLKNDLVFDVKGDFKKFRATHDFLIDELVVPKEYENDFAMARAHAKRKGKIIRHLDIDGRQETKEHDLLV